MIWVYEWLWIVLLKVYVVNYVLRFGFEINDISIVDGVWFWMLFKSDWYFRLLVKIFCWYWGSLLNCVVFIIKFIFLGC